MPVMSQEEGQGLYGDRTPGIPPIHLVDGERFLKKLRRLVETYADRSQV